MAFRSMNVAMDLDIDYRNELFAGAAEDGKEDLLDELEDMEADFI